ncbi:MAG: paraquat-inducible protein A [Thermodesulfobacteriota bacterium]|nr:paraquat-inducible protein A [Thermodesulfobacteriota bacterium]
MILNNPTKDSGQSDTSGGGLIACHKCDLLHRIKPIPDGGKALCTRCGSLLYKNIPNSLDKVLALNIAAFMLFIMANVFPFVSLKLSGRIEENVFISGALALYRLGMGELGLLVFLTSFLFPLLIITGTLYVLLPLKFGRQAWKMAPVYRMVQALMPWSLVAVFMLGVLISIVKLLDLASIIPGVSLFSFVGLMVISTAAHANMDAYAIWPRMRLQSAGNGSGITAAERHLISCHTCALLVPQTGPDKHGHGEFCPRCRSRLHSRKANSLSRTWALIFTASILLIPANLLPVMTIINFGQGDPSTILSGVVHLIEAGMWVLAMIIFFASIVVPVLKLIVLSILLISIQKKSAWRSRDRTLLFRVTEAVGSWSMVDIYVVAILAGLVNLDALATIRPGIGATFFGAVVVITMLAAHSFDPRLIWDNTGRQE